MKLTIFLSSEIFTWYLGSYILLNFVSQGAVFFLNASYLQAPKSSNGEHKVRFHYSFLN